MSRKIIAGFACSLDGYIEGPDGEYDWITVDKEMDLAGQMKRYDTFLIGRRTYEKIRQMKGPKVPHIKNYVFSSTLSEVDPGYLLVSGNVEQQVKQLREIPGKDIAVFGGAGLLTSLLDLQLVDELSIAIIPVLLGEGKPMINVLKKRVSLRHLHTKTYSNGTLQVTYEVLKKDQ